VPDLSAPPPPGDLDPTFGCQAGHRPNTVDLQCWLSAGHDGPHWDDVDGVWWAVPDA
jgi:hypothetical protein